MTGTEAASENELDHGRAGWLLIAILAFAIVGAFAVAMTGFDHNEHMYVTAGVLVANGQSVYKDFAYLQAPYLPWFYGAVYRAVGASGHYLLIAKLLSVSFLGVAALILYRTARRVVRDTFLALGVVALFLCNATLGGAAAEASNYIMPLALSMAAFHVLVGGKPTGPIACALAGLLLAISVGSRLTHATLFVPFAAASILLPAADVPSGSFRGRVSRGLLPFLAGATLGLLPLLFVGVDFERFYFANVGYHLLNAEWRQATGYSWTPLKVLPKIGFACEAFLRPHNLIVLLGIALGLGASGRGARVVARAGRSAGIGAFLAMLFLATVLAALAPTPSFPQYYAMPVSVLFLGLPYAIRGRSEETRGACRKVLLVLVLAAVVSSGPRFVLRIAALDSRDRWSGLGQHDVAIGIRRVLTESGVGTHGKVATLSPLFAVEAGLPIYPELATGPFLYRVGDLIPTEQRERVVATSPRSIGALLAADPPAAVVVGFEGDLDGPLVEYALAQGYRKVPVPGFSGQLYVRATRDGDGSNANGHAHP